VKQQPDYQLCYSLKATALVEIETLYITDVHCTTTKKHYRRSGLRSPAGMRPTCVH